MLTEYVPAPQLLGGLLVHVLWHFVERDVTAQGGNKAPPGITSVPQHVVLDGHWFVPVLPAHSMGYVPALQLVWQVETNVLGLAQHSSPEGQV